MRSPSRYWRRKRSQCETMFVEIHDYDSDLGLGVEAVAEECLSITHARVDQILNKGYNSESISANFQHDVDVNRLKDKNTWTDVEVYFYLPCSHWNG
jgi:hypothetical protein